MSSADNGAGAAPDDPIAWLFSLQRFGMNPGLSRVHALLAALGSPQRSFEVVLVAGTNGKGSTAAVLAACLGAAGRRTGLFTSPHLQRFGERAVVDGRESDASTMVEAVAQVRPHAERLNATFFEVVTAVCALVFKSAHVKVAVMEVGLGGRLDATNALEPVLSIITGVALDHMAVLGDDVAAIASEKAGILRGGVPALTGASGAALEAIEAEARRLGTPLAVLGRDFEVRVVESSWDGLGLVVRGVDGDRGTKLGADPGADLALRTPLVGRHQAGNVALAAAGALHLRVPRAAVVDGVARTRWPGRLERLQYRGRHVVLDGAHNAQAAEALAAALSELAPDCDVLVLGTSADKDQHGLLGPLVGAARHVVVTRATTSPRASEPGRLAGLVHAAHERATQERAPHASASQVTAAPITVTETPTEALAAALELTEPGGVIVVAGSLFLVGEVRSLVEGSDAEGHERWQ